MNRTKIVCTIGPASASAAMLSKMIRAGMNAARLNLSHGDEAGHKKLFRAVRAAAKKAGEPVPIIADLQGPKIRVGDLPKDGLMFKAGETVEFPLGIKGLSHGVKKGHLVLIEDGKYEGKVLAVSDTTLKAKMMNAGVIFAHKGLNFPDSHIDIPAITDKDKKDAAFAVAQGADWIAFSFAKTAQDVKTLRTLVAKAASQTVAPRIMVKIERREAVKNFAEILSEADGVMIARGDLGLEIPAEDVPVAQKQMIELCRLAGKPVVVATQMLGSMEISPRPTRAEVSDVANAVFDHTDAVMLSGETATGKFPLRAVETMTKIVARAEASGYDDVALSLNEPGDEVRSVAYALSIFAQGRRIDGVLSATALVPYAENLLMAHPEIPLYLAVPNDTLARQANLRWGVHPFVLRAPTPPIPPSGRGGVVFVPPLTKGGQGGVFVKSATAHLKRHYHLKKGSRLIAVLGRGHKIGFEMVQA